METLRCKFVSKQTLLLDLSFSIASIAEYSESVKFGDI